MMRLDKVEIVGFKSFCDKQEVSFQGGVTGIVGPNGCGKSNISDAISWVLGEQSVKTLRGASMEDVIFAGSQSRQPLAMAEVNLKVSGLNGNSPDGSPECVVTRRLYRNGDSEYLMNGRTCRLRDIQELFMDTGLGAKGLSIIEQGKIGLILSSKPADRRALIEEAAGITKYKARRRQTQLKLEAAQQNLLRVNDIVVEVEKQLESLKRQAGKARRYRALREEMQALERVAFGLRFLELRGQSTELEERLAAEAVREKDAATALETEETQMEARRTVLYERESTAQQVRDRLNELTLAVDRHQGRSGYCRDQISETVARGEQSRQEGVELEERVGPLAERLQGRRDDGVRLRQDFQAAEDEARAAEQSLQAAGSAQAGAERAQDLAREGLVALMGRLASLASTRASVSGAADRAAATLLKLAAETDELERERERLQQAKDAAQKRGTEAEALRDTLVQQREGATERSRAARERGTALAREAEGVQSERDSLAGRLASLEEMVSTHSAFDEGVRALLAKPEGLDVLGVVADSVDTDEGHERALEAFLGERLQAVLVPGNADALRGVRYLQDSGAGRGTFLPLSTARTKNGCAALADIARQETKARGLLSEKYRVSGPHAERIRAALPDALVVDTLEDALEVVERQGPVACVTRSGETLRSGLVEGGREVKGLLAPRREIREVAARHAELEVRLAELRAAQQAEEQAAAEADAESRQLQERIHAAEKELVAVRHELSTAEEQWSRLVRKAGVLDTERSQAEQERAAAGERLAEIELTLASTEEERARAAQALAEQQNAVAEARSATEGAQRRSAEARAAVAALRERLSATDAECQRLEQDHKDLLARIEIARTRAEEMAARRVELETELAESERLLNEALGARDQVQGEVQVAEDAVRDLRGELEAREASIKDHRRERDVLRGLLSELEVGRARTGSDLDHLARECHQALGMMAAEAAATLTDDDKVRDRSALEVEVTEIRERLDRMGPVNVLAVEQAQEHEERHTFLTAQRQDLLDSIAELDQAIKKIDKISKERFAEAFEIVNRHFGERFRELFGGGNAALSLLDADDILESGIDVMAQPPGKRLQNVMLLSGGEKALTAVSLLFAIFQYKPSPFCILDEVDAPLDDANVGRFVRMLENLKDQTQFVLITHSRKSMEIADQLYGVTMEEPGVSKLVSVRLR
jgi:chromosome segregation protein